MGRGRPSHTDQLGRPFPDGIDKRMVLEELSSRLHRYARPTHAHKEDRACRRVERVADPGT